MSSKKRLRKYKKDISRDCKTLRKIEIAARHYDFQRGDYERILRLSKKLRKHSEGGYISMICNVCNHNNCSGCPAEVEKYCTPDISPMEWDV